MLQYLPFLALLACPVMMGMMMWMMRGKHGAMGEHGPTAASTQEEIAILRAEIALLGPQQDGRSAPGKAEHPAP